MWTAAAGYAIAPTTVADWIRRLEAERDGPTPSNNVMLPLIPMLAEMEDDCETRTQLFLHSDGTVETGATDGMPPVAVCGLWQSGSDSFQMVLQRTFESAPLKGQSVMDAVRTYTVTRVYMGSVNGASNGVKLVDGRIGLYAAEAQLAAAQASGDSDANLGGVSGPIGYFSIDGNTVEELEELEFPREEPAKSPTEPKEAPEATATATAATTAASEAKATELKKALRAMHEASSFADYLTKRKADDSSADNWGEHMNY